jgi:hypothetical protein
MIPNSKYKDFGRHKRWVHHSFYFIFHAERSVNNQGKKIKKSLHLNDQLRVCVVLPRTQVR